MKIAENSDSKVPQRECVSQIDDAGSSNAVEESSNMDKETEPKAVIDRIDKPSGSWVGKNTMTLRPSGGKTEAGSHSQQLGWGEKKSTRRWSMKKKVKPVDQLFNNSWRNQDSQQDETSKPGQKSTDKSPSVATPTNEENHQASSSNGQNSKFCSSEANRSADSVTTVESKMIEKIEDQVENEEREEDVDAIEDEIDTDRTNNTSCSKFDAENFSTEQEPEECKVVLVLVY